MPSLAENVFIYQFINDTSCFFGSISRRRRCRLRWSFAHVARNAGGAAH
jgi:hypothetical protein